MRRADTATVAERWGVLGLFLVVMACMIGVSIAQMRQMRQSLDVNARHARAHDGRGIRREIDDGRGHSTRERAAVGEDIALLQT